MHAAMGHYQEAVGFYEKSLAINPENSNASAMAEQLRSVLE